ncbi:hypothetical protein PTKIN_Ptkin14bG0106800 [Pterospermum kingtungense]
MKCEESSIAVLRRDWEDDKIKLLELKNGEVLLEVDGGKMVSLNLNCQQMGHLEIQLQAEILSVDSYVKSLVLLGEGVNAGSVSYANHANESSGSDARSEEESEMA